ncbi:hypothetical protein BKA66DRAFT_476755 [Pyrenochaeta sp. MPI-SDFR-AT-0127]|nr:hypothetical protein BKA66DRAFT_476755 [Pyrenochaeta sp. MPI-SDFR-AT-0127]
MTKLPGEAEKPRFSQYLTSRVIAVTVADSRAFNLHSDILVAESEKYSRGLSGGFREAAENAIKEDDEDPALFGFFVEYLYRDRSILSREVEHHSEYVTLARLYALGERLMAPTFQATCLWRFTESLGTRTQISEEAICTLLEIACGDIPERVREDPMRSQIFWLGGARITELQKSGMFRQMLCDIPDLGKHLCLWIGQSQPQKPSMPNELQRQKFGLESEYCLEKTVEVTPTADE